MVFSTLLFVRNGQPPLNLFVRYFRNVGWHGVDQRQFAIRGSITDLVLLEYQRILTWYQGQHPKVLLGEGEKLSFLRHATADLDATCRQRYGGDLYKYGLMLYLKSEAQRDSSKEIS